MMASVVKGMRHDERARASLIRECTYGKPFVTKFRRRPRVVGTSTYTSWDVDVSI